MSLSDSTFARLRSQMERAEIVLFTGAGFSMGARDRQGRAVPSSTQLKEELWALSYPDRELDATATLGELFDVARSRRASALVDYLQSRLVIDPDSLPAYFSRYWSLPWLRVYTLNVDNLELAAARRFNINRQIEQISATLPDHSYVPRSRAGDPVLEVIHLNGSLPGPPESLTFSETQYAERIANREPWYARCVADLTTRPVIFIGTDLREIPLWQHMQLRKLRVAQRLDRRPASILVTPALSPSREELLHELRVEWMKGTAESFAAEVLERLDDAGRRGFVALGEYSGSFGRTTLPLVSDLAAERPTLDTHYLSGEEPHWSDLITGRAVERSFDLELAAIAREILDNQRPATALVVTGTAGTGKSTALMRLALALSSDGTPVLWDDRDTRVTPHAIRERVRRESGKVALIVDDADLFGHQMSQLLLDLVPTKEQFLFVVASRSTKVNAITHAVLQAKTVNLQEMAVPGLSDEDIDKLIAVLDKFHRLGILKGKTAAERRQAFSEQAGRQLLVAMINATSDERFEEKARAEVTDLDGAARYAYSLVAVASSLRQYLTKDEVVLAAGDSGGEAAEALQVLVDRHLIVARPPSYEYRARHRVIADLVVERLQELEELKEVLIGLAFATASKINPALAKDERPWRFLIRLMNHEFLGRVLGVMSAREVYVAIEGLVNFDYHYWLQRGSLEVQMGDLGLATQFLDQARSLSPDDYLVQTAYGYLLMRKANEHRERQYAHDHLLAGIAVLEGVIADKGKITPYPFHILGTQALLWSREDKSLLGVAKRGFLGDVLGQVKKGCEYHPWNQQLQELRVAIETEILYSVTVKRR